MGREFIRSDEYATITDKDQSQRMTEPQTELLDAPPLADKPTDYDWAHRVCYLRLLDADAEGADWREVARVVMMLDPDDDPDRAHRAWRSHLDRARWMTTSGYRDYLA